MVEDFYSLPDDEDIEKPPLQENVVGMVGLILAAAACVASLCSLPAVLSLLLWVGGLVCSIIGLTKEPKLLAIIGICICGAWILLTIIAALAAAMFVSSMISMF